MVERSVKTARSRARFRVRPALVSAIVAVVLTVVAFPEVVLLGGSLSATGLSIVVDDRVGDEVSVYPNLDDRDPSSGLVDVGARAWQLEPAPKFMNRTIYSGDSPEWNPYSAGGSLGPETLADLKLSPFVLAVAVLGGSSAAFTIVSLLLVVAGLYCLLQFFTRTLRMSRLAGIAACVVFLLNGWATATGTSQTSAAYVWFPIALYALTEYQRVGGPARLLATVAVYAALISTTFLPGVVLVLILVHAIAILLEVRRERGSHDREGPSLRVARLVGRQALVPMLALLTTAYIWLPNMAAVLRAGDEMTQYGTTDLPSKTSLEALTILTPRHVYWWYRPDTVPVGIPVGRWTMYLGIAPLMFVLAALPRARDLGRQLLILATALMALGVAMHLGVPGSTLIGSLPFLEPISGSYWASFAAGAATVAFAVAVETAVHHGLSTRVALGTAAVVVAVFGWGLIEFGDATRETVIGLGLAALTVTVVSILILLGSRVPVTGVLFGALVVAVVAAELLSYQNHQRVRRFDHEDHLPEYVTFVQENVGDGRVYSAGRGALYPEWGAALGIRQIETLNLMQAPWYRTFFRNYVNPREPQMRFLENGRWPRAGFSANPKALDQLSVRYLIVDQRYKLIDEGVAARYPLVLDDQEANIKVYENPTALPRAYVVGAVESADRRPEAPRFVPPVAFAESEQLVAEARAVGVPATADASPAGAEATVIEEDNDRVVLAVETAEPAVVVLTDTHHPNWQADVNGEPSHIGRVNDVARGVVVPAGSSTVVFTYHSTPRLIGAIISALSVIGLLIVCASWGVRRRRRDARPGVRTGDMVGEPVGPPVG